MTDASQPAPGTRTIDLTDRQLWLIRSALQEYLASLSHTEGKLVEETKDLLARLPTAGNPADDVNQIFPEGRRLTL
jgi:hypothetical protein